MRKRLGDEEGSVKSWLLGDQAHEKLEELIIMFDTLLSDGSVEPKQTGMLKTRYHD